MTDEMKQPKTRITRASARSKGRELQKWTCQQISDLLNIPWGKDELIASREASQTGTDVRLIGEAKERFPFSVECKAQETWSVLAWAKQAEANRVKGTDWLLVMKKSRIRPIVAMDAEKFFNLQQTISEAENMKALLRGARLHLNNHKCLEPKDERCDICYLLDEIDSVLLRKVPE